MFPCYRFEIFFGLPRLSIAAFSTLSQGDLL